MRFNVPIVNKSCDHGGRLSPWQINFKNMRSKYIRFFVSSTFKDMELERNLLQEVFDELIPFYREKGWHVETVDLRWGISEEAGLDNRTMRICKKELAQCMKMSPKPNFIILLGNRYGWIPLPETICKSDFDSLEMTKQESDLFNVWYKLDKNALPNGEYVLQGRTGDFCEKEVWEAHVVKPLGEMLSRNANRLHNESLYGLSATEQEIRQGALSVSDAKEHVLAYIRDIKENKVAYKRRIDFFEANAENRNKLEVLKDKIRKHLSNDNIIETKGKKYSFLSSTKYKIGFREVMTSHITSIIDNVISSFKEETLTENDLHIEYALDKARHFVGREKELVAIKQYIESSETKPFWIKGPSGIGKSSLLAKIVEEYIEHYDIICRFCGTTEESSEAFLLARSIIKELDSRDVTKRRITSSNNLSNVAGLFFEMGRKRIYEHPILLIIDAIDQVYDKNIEDFKKCAWITTGNNHMLKIVYSSLEDGFEPSLNTQSLILSGMGGDAESLLYNQLYYHNRRISDVQKTAIVQCIEQSDKSPLFIYILSQFLLDVPSWEELKNIPTSIDDLINLILTDLSKPIKHGEILVKTALSFLTLDRIGVSDSEMLSLLADDDEVYNSIKESCKRNKHEIKENGLRRLPAVFWIRLCNDLKTILRSRITDVGQMNTIFHNGIRQALEKRYLKGDSLSLHYWESLNERYKQNYLLDDKHSLKELIYSYYAIACHVSRTNQDSFFKYRETIVQHLTSNWTYISKKKHYFPTSLIEDYDRIQHLFNKPNKTLEIFRNELYRIKDPVKEEHVILYLANLSEDSPVKISIKQSNYSDIIMDNILSVSKKDGTLFYAKEIGESPHMSEDGTTIASLFKDNKELRIENLVEESMSRKFIWKEPILEMICDETISLCAIRTARYCCIHDTINNKILVSLAISKKGWMSLSADGLTFLCGDNGNAYIYNNHQFFSSYDNVRIAKVSPSGKFFWILLNDGSLHRIERDNDNGCSFPVSLEDKQGELYNPLEAAEGTIIACSDESCCCHTPTATLYIFHYVQDEKDKFELKYGNMSPIFAYSDDCRQYIDNSGCYWIIDEHGAEQKVGQIYLNDQLYCINRSFTKALSSKELRVFDFIKEIGNYNISGTYQNGYINHALCSNNGEEIVVSVGIVFGGPFASGNKTEALRYSSQQMFSWSPSTDNPNSGIYSSAISPNSSYIATSVLTSPSQLILCNAKHNDCINKIDLPQWQTGCTDIVFSTDSNFLLAITGDYVSDPDPLYLYVLNNSGKILFIKEWGWEYNRNSLYISNNNRFLLLGGQKYAVYDLIKEREIIDDAHRLPYNSYSFFKDICYRMLSKDYLVICPSTNVVLSSDKEKNLLYRYDLDSCQYTTLSCEKVIIACSSTGRFHYYLDKDNKLYLKDWLRNPSFEHLLDNVLWVVPALDEHHIYITLADYTILLYNVHSRQIEQKAYRGMTTHQQACAQGLMTVNTSCEVSMYKAADKYNVNIPAATTFVRRWNLETKRQESLSAICPMCGGKIELNNEIKPYLKDVPHNKRYEDWDNPKLFGHHCPHCNAELQFNPYIV